MTAAEWLSMQEQLWGAFGPLILWWLAFLLAGFIAVAVFLFGLTFLSDWMNG